MAGHGMNDCSPTLGYWATQVDVKCEETFPAISLQFRRITRLAPRMRLVLEKPALPQMLKKFPVFYETRRFTISL
jgi:hypothetical protein